MHCPTFSNLCSHSEAPWRRIAAGVLGIAIAALTLGASSTGGTRHQAALAKGEAFLDLQDSIALRAVEGAGYGFESLFGIRSGERASPVSALAENPAFGFIGETVAGDVRALAAEMNQEGVPLTSAPKDNVARVIDLDWLRSPHAHFELVAVVNRIDRRNFREEPAASCGEIRFIYRLAYRFGDARRPFSFTRRAERASRLPFLFNAVFDLPAPGDGECTPEARGLMAPRDLQGAALVEWLTTGPLHPSRLKLRQIELNAQVIRIPSELEPGFGGQAIYLMRIFGVEGIADGRPPTVRRLENMPDEARLRGDDTLLADLAAFIEANRPAIQSGVYRLPERLLAEKALSFSTFGSSRAANHPFTALSDRLPADRSLLARLDAGTCTGCHQHNATAGFHVFGLDRADAFPLNRVELGASPHFYADRERRRAYVTDLAAGRTPRAFRPLPHAPAADWSNPHHVTHAPAGLGMPCEEEASGGSSWSCAPGLACRTIMRDSRGLLATRQCLPVEPSNVAGLACWSGEIAARRRAYRDRVTLVSSEFGSQARRPNASDYFCLPPRLGVPGGLTYRICTPGEALRTPDICAVGGSRDFDVCVAGGDFASCLSKSLTRALRQSCGADRHCREDYACQALPEGLAGTGAAPGTGFCSPTYLVFQLRIDGHPNPLTGP